MEHPYIVSLIETVATEERYNCELDVAKGVFEKLAGPIYEDANSYEDRTNSFHNWYVLDRPLLFCKKTPLTYFMEYHSNSLSAVEKQGYESLAHNVHSVFELIKKPKTDADLAKVRDLITRKKYAVETFEKLRYLDAGAIFNTRILPIQKQKTFRFSNYVVVHPANVEEVIVKSARAVRKQNADKRLYLFQLLLFQGRWEQYKQMPLQNIYRFA